jgi:murein tripeptide amidase MpaA
MSRRTVSMSVPSLAIVLALGLASALAWPGGARALASPPPAQPPAAKALPALPFDHILRYDEFTALLQAWAAARPDLVELESLGKTPEGRELWFLTLTSRATGPASAKPAIAVDGNEHATEWGGGVAALHFTHHLLARFGSDERVTRLLETRAVYVLPRLTPDGVEATLAQGRFIRSVARPYPNATPENGIHPRDLDGDGRAVFMRYRDPNGPWKEYPGDRRLLVPRAPDETGGDFWRVLPEGRIEGYDGATIADPPAFEPIDLGANFPGDLRENARGRTAGAYPLSEPEIAAYVAALASRPNIVAHVTCHTFGGLVLTPPVNLAETLPGADRKAFEKLAGRAAELTGYRAMSYLDLRAEDRESYIPSAFGWLYDQRGILSFITEFWDPFRAAGISLAGTTASAWLWGYHPVADEVALLLWSDAELGGDGFVPWRRFDHPQLGEVEIGGFDLVRYWYNIPFDRLEQEVAPHSEWLVYLGLSTPRLAIRTFSADPLGADLWRVRLVVENQGFLPTHGAQKALDQQVSRGVFAELTLPPGARLVDGAPQRRMGELQGRIAQRSTATWWGYSPGTPDRAVADWIVAAPAGSTIAAEASHDRAGRESRRLVLGSSDR